MFSPSRSTGVDSSPCKWPWTPRRKLWNGFVSSFNYELYFGFSWIFAFISVDRWIKVEWPTKSQTLCTRRRFIYLCLLTFVLSLLQNIIYTFACINDKCTEKNLACEVFVHSIYISIYMTIPIAIILISICRTCSITLHVKRRFQPSKAEHSGIVSPMLRSPKAPPFVHGQVTLDPHIHIATLATPVSSSFVSSLSATTGTHPSTASPSLESKIRLANYKTYLRRRRSGLDAQMIMLITINVAPFVLVQIITEIAYLFEKYSEFVAHSAAAKLSIILIYLSWYFISATRFYTNCLLSRIYREEFLNRLRMLRRSCKPRIVLVDGGQSPRLPSRYFVTTVANGTADRFVPVINLNSVALLWIPTSLLWCRTEG